MTHAQQNLEHRCKTLDLRCGDIWHLPFADNAFDVVIFAHVLEHMANPVETVRVLNRVPH
ncbi:MAG: methyltransferase domain-containing protein [Cyanobacteria bacterium J06649_12]